MFYKSTSIHPAAQKALQAENPQPVGQDREVSARRIGAGLGASRDRAPGVRQGEEAREGVAAKRAPETPSERRAWRIWVTLQVYWV